MRRTHAAAEDLPESTSESTVALIARLSAEHDVPPVGALGQRRHSRGSSGAAVVTRDTGASRGGGIRRLAPVAVGAVVMLVATLVLTTVRSPQPPVLADQSAPVATAAPAAPYAAPTTQAPLPSTSPVVAATPAPPKPAAPRPPAPGSAVRPAPRAGDGPQAATARGWVLATADEFNGTALGGQWGPYDGAGNGGEGRRSPDAISVQNGIMTIRGDSKGTTGGMAWSADQRFGKWEVRARFPKGDKQYHPVLLLWPEGKWPDGGEVDFAETTSASSDVSFFLHYSSSNKQKSAERPLDLTQWHNYAVEWVNGRITGFIDGQQWFQSTDGSTLPPGQMHIAIQLDYFPDGGSPKPTQMDVDYVRIYK
jgi:Glycosyl hydrolases family 16